MKRVSEASKDKSRHSKLKSFKKSKSTLEQKMKESSATGKKIQVKDEEKPKDTALSECEIMELQDDQKPLSCFVDNPDKMIEQLFTTLRTADIMQMIPKSLKICNIEEAKKLCLIELKLLSRDSILHILKGDDPLTCSDNSDTKTAIDATRETDSTAETKSSLKRKLSEELFAESSHNLKKYGLEKPGINPIDIDVGKNDTHSNDALLELYPTSKEMENMDKSDKKELSPSTWNEGTDFELLELEMRARAIRSLLRSRGLNSSDEDTLNE